MRKISKRIILLISIIAVLVVGGCAETAEDEKQFNEEEYVSGNYPTEGEGFETNVNSARYVEEIDGHSLPKREEVLEIELTVKNDSSVRLDIEAFNFHIRDVEGRRQSFHYSSNDMNFDGSIGPGKEFTGKFYFDVPERESYELVYTQFDSESNDRTFLVSPENGNN